MKDVDCRITLEQYVDAMIRLYPNTHLAILEEIDLADEEWEECKKWFAKE